MEVKLGLVIFISIVQIMHLGYVVAKHGLEKKPSKYDAFITFLATITTCIIYYFAGFYDVFKS
jgi:hypothetical protein